MNEISEPYEPEKSETHTIYQGDIGMKIAILRQQQVKAFEIQKVLDSMLYTSIPGDVCPPEEFHHISEIKGATSTVISHIQKMIDLAKHEDAGQSH